MGVVVVVVVGCERVWGEGVGGGERERERECTKQRGSIVAVLRRK